SHSLYVYTLAPVPGVPQVLAPTITRGRAPAAADEIALGSRSLAAAKAGIGDKVELTYLGVPHRMTVVGEVVVNDGYEPVPGVGAVVTPEWLDSVDQVSYVSDFAIRFRPADRARGVAQLEREYPGWTSRPTAPHSIVNLQRISAWAGLL